jgi:hypothetical protein
MSGELRASVDWTPAEPVAEKPKRRRKERKLPTTRGGMILYGIRRFVLIAGSLCGVVALGAALVLWQGGGSATRVFTLAFYFVGAGFGAMAVLGGTGTYHHDYWDRPEREQSFNAPFVYAALAVVLLGVGVALDLLL